MKRPLCTICLLFAAAVAACTLIFPQRNADREKSAQDVSDAVPAVFRDAAAHGDRVCITGRVSVCRQYENQTVLWLSDIAVSGINNEAVPPEVSIKEKGICYLEKTTLPQIGSIVCVEGVPGGFLRARNPGEFDSARYYRAQGAAFRLKDAVLISSSKSKTPFRAALMRMRAHAAGIFSRYLCGREAGALSAMLLGDKSGLEDGLRSLYAKSGIAHILAISGLHISLFGTMLNRMLRRISAPRAVSMTVCCAFLLSYSVMTGLSASTLRASVMFVIGLNAGRVRRTYDMKTAIGVSMALQLLVNPRLIGTAAFQLSFAAVCGIAWLTPAILSIFTDCLPLKSRGLTRRAGAFAACLAVSAATLPILLVHQYEYAVYGLVWNPIVLPGVAVLLPVGFLLLAFGAASDGFYLCAHLVEGALSDFAGMAGLPDSAGTIGVQLLHLAGKAAEGSIRFVGKAAGTLLCFAGMITKGLARAAAFFCSLLLSFYEYGSRFVVSLPGSLLRGRPRTVRIVIYAVMLLGLTVFAKRCRKRREGAGSARRGHMRLSCISGKVRGVRCAGRLRGIFGVCWLVIALLVLLVPVRTGLTVTMLDVGQGDGICIEQTPGHAVLIDCGSSDQRKLFENRLMPFLKYRGIYEVDAVFLSHLDTDHVSAVYDLLKEMRTEKINVGCIVVGQEIPHDEAYGRLLAAAEEAHVPVHAMCAGDVYEQGAYRLTCLGPSKGSGGGSDRNARSLILRLDYGEFQALFTGDADARAELAAVQVMNACMPQEDIELLKTAHHGSRNSTSDEFLRLVSPRIAVISAGEDNSYGHPHLETLARLEESGCDIYQTPKNGAVTIHVDGTGMRVETFLGGTEPENGTEE